MITENQCNKTMEQLKKITLKAPEEAGIHWKGIKHFDLVHSLMNTIVNSKAVPKKSRFCVSNGGLDLAGAIQVANGPPMLDGFESWIGFVSSNSRRKGLKFFSGVVETKTDVPLINGMFVAGHKRTIAFDLEAECHNALETWWEYYNTTHYELKHLNELQFRDEQPMRILFTAGRKKIIPWSRIGVVDKIFRRCGKMSGFSLIRAFHEVNSRSPAQDQMVRNMLFCQLLPAVQLVQKT